MAELVQYGIKRAKGRELGPSDGSTHDTSLLTDFPVKISVSNFGNMRPKGKM